MEKTGTRQGENEHNHLYWLLDGKIDLAVGTIFTFYMAQTEDVRMRVSLLNENRLAQSAVNWRRIQSLTGNKEDIVSPDYLRLKEQLTLMRATRSQCRFMYLMG